MSGGEEMAAWGTGCRARRLRGIESGRPAGSGALLLLLLFIAIFPRSTCAVESDSLTSNPSPVRFGEILILRKDVFNPSVPGLDRFPFRILNKLHVVTKDNVIREQLLIRDGDIFDQSLLDESERVLRRLSFIGAASAVALDEKDGSRRVVVETQDQWSTNLELEIDRFKDSDEGDTRDENGFEVTLSEDNFLGWGKKIRFRARHEFSETQLGYLYEDPNLLDTRWIMKGAFQDRSRGKEWEGLILRPFYSLGTRWSLGWQSVFEAEENLVFRDGIEEAVFFQEIRNDEIFVGRMFGPRYRRKVLLRVSAAHRDQSFSDLASPDGQAEMPDFIPPASLLPEGERGPSLMSSLRFGSFRFKEERRLDNFIRVEDVELGGFIGVEAGRIATNRSRWRLGAQAAWGGSWGTGRYYSLFGQLISHRRRDRWIETELSSALQAYAHLGGWNTLAGRIALDRGWKMLPGDEFFLGENNGLRGFPARSSAGPNRLLLNVEDRLFSDLVLYTVAIGGALFVDGGAVWEDGTGISWNDLDAGAGFGLRFGLTKSRSSPVIRIDLARNLTNGSYRFSVISGHIFALLRPFREFTLRQEDR